MRRITWFIQYIDFCLEYCLWNPIWFSFFHLYLRFNIDKSFDLDSNRQWSIQWDTSSFLLEMNLWIIRLRKRIIIQGHSSGWYHWFLSQSLIDSSFSTSLSISIHSHFTVSLQNRFRLYHQSSSSQFNCWRIERRLCWRLSEWKHLQLSEFKSKELCTQITDRNNDKNRILFNRSWTALRLLSGLNTLVLTQLVMT